MLKDIRETLILGSQCRERFLPLHAAPAEPLCRIGLQLAGLSELTPQYRVTRLAPPYHVVLVTTGGHAELAMSARRTVLPADSITVLPAGSSYTYSPGAAGWSVAWFHLANRPMWRALADCRSILSRDGQTLARLANVYTDEIAAGREQVAAAVASALAVALREILRADPSVDGEVADRMRLVMRAVETDLARRWTEADLAALAHYSAQHLRRLAKAYWGAPPLQAVTKARMRRAMALLEFSSLRLSAIAAAVGYSDEFAFSTAFRRHTGQSPRAWRAGSREE